MHKIVKIIFNWSERSWNILLEIKDLFVYSRDIRQKVRRLRFVTRSKNIRLVTA